jgi:metal-responsive CopG/Arc/MetJ family transcriptional regulator
MKSFTVRLEGALETAFDEIKDSLGLKNDSEVVRFLVKNYGTLPKPEEAAISG